MTEYGKRPMWQWVLLYVLLGGLVYFLVYYFFVGKNKENSMYGNEMQQETFDVDSSLTTLPTATFALTAQNDSGQSGQVTLTEADGMTTVYLSLTGYPIDGVPQPAHIHVGTCPDVGEVVHPLNDVVDGVSETVLETTIADLSSQLPLGVNVHKSADEPSVYTACGDVVLSES